MRILEIGAGTGGQTLRLIQKMSEDEVKKWHRYDYTDLSPGFFDQAQEKFKDYLSKMSFRVCRKSKDPVTQSFEQGSYDIVVASHVLHATNDLKQSLRHIRKLLKPNGKLLLFETTLLEAIPIGFAFGLLEGWWSPLDHEPRSMLRPCLYAKQRDRLLKSTGFSGVDVDIPGQEELKTRYSSIIDSSTVEDANGYVQSGDFPEVSIIFDPQVEEQKDHAHVLQARINSLNFPTRVSTLTELMESHCTPPQLMISLLEVDNIFINGISSNNLDAPQNVIEKAARDLPPIRGCI